MKKVKKLIKKQCMPCEGGIPPLNDEEINSMLKGISEWVIENGEVKKLCRTFQFENYYQNIAFINAVVWIAHQEDHHPYLEIEYGQCTVKYWTHAIAGLSENDFICASKINAIHYTDMKEDFCKF